MGYCTSCAASHRALRGARVVHVNATPYGGGVSELLRSTVPLLHDLGIVAHWRIIRGDERFFQVTKSIHNALQGAERELTVADRAAYFASSRANAGAFLEEYDFVFIHDPQPAALLSMRGKGAARWIWRCHIDTARPNPVVWSFLRPFLVDYDAAVFTMSEFVPPDFPVRRVEIVPPAIDPLSAKNLALPEATARAILEWIGVRSERPLVTQVSRFDRWKDPLGVIEAYRIVRREIPDLQMADGVGGALVDDISSCAAEVLALLRDGERARALGASGRERVRAHFLVPRLVLNELQLMADLAAVRPIERPPDWARGRDPVCGMALGDAPTATATYAGVTYGFCSIDCKTLFVDMPSRFLQ